MNGRITRQLRASADKDRKSYRLMKKFYKTPSRAPGGRNIVHDKEV